MVVTRHPDDAPAPKTVTTVVKPITKPATDTARSKPPVIVNNNTRPVPDTIAAKPVAINNAGYAYAPAEAHYVVLVLNKVDPVFSNEAKNAFIRYNRDNYFNKTFTIDLVQVDIDNRLMLVTPFANAQEAVAYVDKVKPKTASEILPWLRGGKYTYSIISESNLNLLKAKKDVEAYKSFIEQHHPGKF
jgi:hypothetical protein